MGTLHIEEINCRSALNRVQGMPFKWSLNPYQGCAHACHYCYARRFHGYRELNADEDWESILFAKTNIAPVLRREMSRPGWVGEQVAIGTATDPYQPIEGRYRLTRACLQAFADHGNPVSLVTKGSMVIRDRDVLERLANRGGVTVIFSLTTLDESLWRQLEPGTTPPHQRLLAMKHLVSHGIRAGVLVAPVIPGLTDHPDNLEAIVRAAAEHRAQCLGGRMLYLMPGTRGHFMRFVQANFPELLEGYERLYRTPYVPRSMTQRLSQRLTGFKDDYDLVDSPAPPARAVQQLQLDF